MSKPTIYYFSSTHWDREWYESFQGFRYRLVAMMNELIDVLERQPEFTTFHLDGQTIVLEDYMAIEPAKRERLARLIQDGRVVVGPWYVMPDEFLVSGESLIRNLLTGGQISREWGSESWRYGYVCDIFGHIAQMPQIFRGFDIPYAVLGRGVNEHDAPAHFRWSSPDGSECIAFKLQDEHSYGAFLVTLNEAERNRFTREQTKELIKTHTEREMSRSPIPVILLMDSQDHGRVRRNTADYLHMLRELYPDAEVRHDNLEAMGRQLESFRDRMPVLSGELNEPGKQPGSNYLIPYTLSSRYPLKRANDECQILLEKWVEPLAALAELRGYSVQKSYIDLAYKYLLQNHPHDSICGCSIDQVHQDMQYRFDQVREIGTLVVEDILNGEREPFSGTDAGGANILRLWNPLPFPRRGVVTVELDFEPGYPAQYQEPLRGYERKNSFQIYNVAGEEIPYGLCRMKRNYSVRDKKTLEKTVDRHTVSLEVEVPAMGTAEYRIVPSSSPSRYLTRLSRHDREVENEYVRLSINDNGTITIYDKRNDRLYDQLLSYLDDGEIGDGWYHVNPVEDRVVGSQGAECVIETVENGPVRTVFHITHYVRVPAHMEQHQHGLRRSEERVVLEIRSRVGLSKGAAHVDVETVIDNRAKDHRLRLVVPTRVTASTYFANQAFAFVERRTGIRTETQNWKECDVAEKQMGGIVGKRRKDGTGLAFVSAYGLHECAVPNDDRGNIHVTMFRSFQKTYLTNGEEGGQIAGKLMFKYAIAVLDAADSYADLTRLQECLQTDIRSALHKVGDDYVPAPAVSYFGLSGGDICMSILKRPQDGAEKELVVRCYNLSGQPSSARFTCFGTIKEVSEANMKEEAVKAIAHEADSFDIRLGGWKIQTYRIKFA